MSVAQQLRQEGRHTKALDIAKNMLSNLHLDMQTVAHSYRIEPGRTHEVAGREKIKSWPPCCSPFLPVVDKAFPLGGAY
jgi:hypothetical protein